MTPSFSVGFRPAFTAIDQNGKMLGPVFTSNTCNVEADISVSIPNVISVSLAPQ